VQHLPPLSQLLSAVESWMGTGMKGPCGFCENLTRTEKKWM